MDLPFSAVTIQDEGSLYKIIQSSKNAERGFCSACGSTLTMRYTVTPETVYLTLGSADNNGGGAGEGGGENEERIGEVLKGLGKKHLYMSEKVGWYDVPDDGWPRFETMPNDKKYLGSGE